MHYSCPLDDRARRECKRAPSHRDTEEGLFAEANKRGMTTVNPATPGAPSETSFDSLLKDSVETEAAKQGKKNKKHKKAATHEAAPRESTPQVKTTTPKSPKTDKPPKGMLHLLF